MSDGADPTIQLQGSGSLAATISTTFVQLVKEHADRGPTKCRTYIDDDLVIVLMRGGFSRLENTLFEDGKWLDVRSMRHAFQDTMEGRFTEVIERLTGKAVTAFMSASHQRPDLQIEVFVLNGTEPQDSAEPRTNRAGGPQRWQRISAMGGVRVLPLDLPSSFAGAGQHLGQRDPGTSPKTALPGQAGPRPGHCPTTRRP